MLLLHEPGWACSAWKNGFRSEVCLEAGPLPSLSDEVKLCIFRVVQEGLRNAVLHGHARKIRITLSQHQQSLLLRIEDTGMGFDAATARAGLGLLSMEERLQI